MATVVSLVPYPFLPAKNGGQKHIALFYKYFCRNVSLTCAGTRDNDASAAIGYAFVPLLSASRLRYVNPQSFFRLRKLIRAENAAYLLIEHPYLGWLGMLIRRFCGVALLVRSHNIESLRWRSLGKWWWKLLWYYERTTHRAADHSFFIQDNDMAYAISSFGLDPAKCSTITYGIEIDRSPGREERAKAKAVLQAKYGLTPDHHLLLFNGDFSYAPNRDGLQIILDEIHPRIAKLTFPYAILICGRGLSADVLQKNREGIIFTGFVDDMSLYLLGADMFINPVLQGGGIKTKLVEALGFGMQAVSTVSGAVGIDPAICSGKLLITADNDWPAFAQLISNSLQADGLQGSAYYDRFYWGSIAARAAAVIT